MEELKNEKENQNVTKIDRKNLEIERESFDLQKSSRKSRKNKVKTGKISETIKDIKKWNIISISIIGLSVIFIILWIGTSTSAAFTGVWPIFNNVFFYLFLVCLIAGIILYLNTWRQKISISEKLILESIQYRAFTGIPELAKSKKMSEKEVRAIVNLLIEKKRIYAEIENDTIVLKNVGTPNCGICDRPIYEVAINLAVCSYCKRPFHKDHLLEYFQKFKKKCPECGHSLDLRDIYKPGSIAED